MKLEVWCLEDNIIEAENLKEGLLKSGPLAEVQVDLIEDLDALQLALDTKKYPEIITQNLH